MQQASRAIDILLIEDEPADIELTIRAFREGGVKNTIHVARDGEDALDFIFCRGAYSSRNVDGPPRLILLDLKLPGLDGLEVLRELKADERSRSIPVVVLTSSRQDEDMLLSYSLGVNSYVQKPVDFQHFQHIVTQVGLYWLRVNVMPPSINPCEADAA